MLRLRKTTDYAMLILATMASREEERMSARGLAEDLGLPRPLVANLLKTLTRAGLLRSTRGVRGGYTLNRPSDRITLREVAAATGGPLRLTDCTGPAAHGKVRCRFDGRCPVRKSIRGIHRKIDRLLAGVTVAGIASGRPESKARGERGGRKQ